MRVPSRLRWMRALERSRHTQFLRKDKASACAVLRDNLLRASLTTENAALRHQLAVLHRELRLGQVHRWFVIVDRRQPHGIGISRALRCRDTA